MARDIETLRKRIERKKRLLEIAEDKYEALLSTGGVYHWSTTDGDLARELNGATLSQLETVIDRLESDIELLETELEAQECGSMGISRAIGVGPRSW